MANAHLPYSIEYAKHSNCKRCCESIPEGSLRCSINRPAYHSEGYIDSWYHYECFWKKLVRGKGQINISSIRGVDLIRWEDQEELRERIRKFKESRGCSYLSEEIYLHDVFIEPSFSNRGKCTKCSIYFQKGEIKVTHSVHFKCFIASFDKIHGKLEDMPRWKMISNKWRTAAAADFDEIMMAKQAQVKNEVVENTERSTVDDMASSSVTGKRRSAFEEPVENDSEEIMEQESEFARKRRLGKSARLALIQERKMEKQTDELRKNLQIFNSMSVPDRIVVLKENGQEVPEGGYDRNKQIVERLSDYALFGCPIHCVKCFNGTIVYNSSRRVYTCSGYVSEYTKCTYETKTPTRTPFILPRHFYEKYKLHDAVFNLMSERLYHKEEDSEEVLVRVSTPIKLSEEKKNSTQIIKNGTLVDAKFLYAGHCHVLKNEDDGTIYQATLSLADLTTNKNSFYKMQLLQDDITKHCYLFKSWGRVGTDVGSSNYDCECNKEYAIAKFEQLFHEKTGNEWKYRKYFRKMPGRYNQVETDDSEIIEIGEQYVAPGSKTCLPQSVKEVVMTIFNIGNMETALKFFKMDTNKMPLGCLSRNQINQAFSVLRNISDLINELPMQKDKVLDASNKFYNIIPHNFGMKVPEPIDSSLKIVEKNNMLNALLDIKFAYDQICGSNPKRGIPGIDLVDTNYEKLKCIMTPLQRDSEDWNHIIEYIHNTQGSTHDIKVDLVDILKLDRADESTKFMKNIGNRRLLWHGSGKMNFAGILGQGLRIAPPEAPSSGYMFGKGVYFADMFSKSFFYCRAFPRDEAYLLLCDVALGNITECMQATPYNTIPMNCHSVKGIGRECPMENGNYVHSDGYIIPKGKKHILQGYLNRDYFLLYNEYVVYNVNQIQMKYLVRVKVHHARHH